MNETPFDEYSLQSLVKTFPKTFLKFINIFRNIEPVMNLYKKSNYCKLTLEKINYKLNLLIFDQILLTTIIFNDYNLKYFQVNQGFQTLQPYLNKIIKINRVKS